ncbi:DUF2934 domain-containing protein [Bradyrhizobium sp. WSM2793]|uniref:DUF2934 domain-containing protein n=1 Tax=Bradyrhizobium sp. WSM2793 TaxID=1038866 RepID=UPI00035FDD29|nr:DUF2934 domain-containing protein [Bradyrhizobium sp. WSM2793]
MQSAFIDHLSELRRLEHQLRLARHAAALITDQETAKRLEEFAGEISRRVCRLKLESLEHETRRRAYELWERAGRPHGRDAEFWLRAEREVLDQAKLGSCEG